jgi:hypothetical protein
LGALSILDPEVGGWVDRGFGKGIHMFDVLLVRYVCVVWSGIAYMLKLYMEMFRFCTWLRIHSSERKNVVDFDFV